MIRAVLALALVTSADALSPAIPMQKGNLLSSPFESIKRSNLKRQLVKAANQKDEGKILELVEELSALNPTEMPTRGLMGYGGAETAPLAGSWKLLFTNAKDAEAPARTEKKEDEKFGDTVASGVKITTGQRIDASKGECVNFIFAEGEKRPFDQLEITIKMTPLSDTRVRLDFLRGRALNDNAPLPFLKDFRFNFPPSFVGDALAALKGKDPTVDPPAFFDVLYIDDEIRAHKTGEGKIFVQQRGAD